MLPQLVNDAPRDEAKPCGCDLAPCTVKAAMRQVSAWHRHLPDLQGGLFAVQCLDADGAARGVAVAGNPSRVWQGLRKIVISRVATLGCANDCSRLYGSLCRAAKALGYREAWTYTLPEEPGTSLRAAGFMDMGLTDGGEWSRPSRRRAAAVRNDRKRRWLRILSTPTPTRLAVTSLAAQAGDRVGFGNVSNVIHAPTLERGASHDDGPNWYEQRAAERKEDASNRP